MGAQRDVGSGLDEATLPRMLWVLRFGTELHRLHPLLPGPTAARIAAQAFAANRHVCPESAARLHAETMPPVDRDLGMSRDGDA